MGALGIDVRVHERLLSIDPVARTARTVNGRFGFDSIVLATGAKPRGVYLRGTGKKGVFLMRTRDDYLALSRSRPSASHAVVLGPAPISLVVADVLSAVAKVRVFLGAGGLSRFAPAARRFLSAAATRRGVELLEAEVDAVLGADSVEAVVSAGTVYPSDCVVVIPVRDPALPQATCAAGAHGGFLVNGSMRTSVDCIFAAGDCSELRLGTGSISPRLYSSSGVMGRVAGINAAGGVARASLSFLMPLNLFGVELFTVGITLQDAASAGFDAARADSDSDELLSGGRIYTSIVYERLTHRILGMQAIGSGALSWCNYASLVVASGATLEELSYSECSDLPSAGTDKSPIGLTASEALARAQERAVEAQGTRLRYG